MSTRTSFDAVSERNRINKLQHRIGTKHSFSWNRYISLWRKTSYFVVGSSQGSNPFKFKTI